MSETTPRSYRVSTRLEGGWGRPNREQLGVLIVTIPVMIVCAFIGGFIATCVAALVGLALYAPVYMKPLRYPGINAIELRLERRRIRKRGGNIFSRDLKDSTLKFDTASHSLQPLASPKDRSISLLSFVPHNGYERLAFFRRKDKHCDDLIAVLLVDGADSLIWSEEYDRFFGDARIIRAFKRAIGTTTKPLSFAQFIIRRPSDATEPLRYAERRWHEDFLNAEKGSAEARQVEQARAEDDIMYRQGAAYKFGVAFRMEFPEKWRDKDLSTLSQDVVWEADIVKLVRSFRKSLTGVTANPHHPSLFELNELGYLLFNANPDDLAAFYVQMHADMKKDEEGDFASVEDAFTLKRGPFPAHLSLHHDHLLANRTYHSHLMVTNPERGDYAPGFLDGLYQWSGDFIYSHVVHTMDYASSMKRRRRKRIGLSFLAGFISTLIGRAADPDLNPEAEQTESDAREAQHSLFYSRSRAILSRISMTVSGPSCEDTQAFINAMGGEMLSHGLVNEQLLGADADHQLEPLLSHLCLQEKM